MGEQPPKQDGKDAVKRKKGGKKKEAQCQPGMSFLCEPCPHRVYTPKPGEREKSEPRGTGSPWYVKTRKKEDVDKEEEEKSKKKETAEAEKRKKAAEERQKKKEEDEKNEKEKQRKREEKEKKREEKRKQKEKEKKKEEDEKREKQKEQRRKEKKEKDEEKKKGGKEEKTEPQPSYMYEPCPHRVYTPGPGEKDMADPRGAGSPWYVKTVKKEELDKEEEEKREKDKEKSKEDRKKRQQEKKQKEKQEAEARKKCEKEKAKKEEQIKRQIENRKKEMENMKKRRELEDIEHEEIGQGVRESKTDFRYELKWMMDFIRGVQEQERERRGESLRVRKEDIEEEMESRMAKEAFTSDFKTFVQTFIEAEWSRVDEKLKRLEKDEKKRRRKIFKNMEPLAKDMMDEAKRTDILYRAAMGKRKGSGESEPNAMENMVVGMIMQQMDKLANPLDGPVVNVPFSLI